MALLLLVGMTASASPLLRGDVDRDGGINVGDAIRVLRITVGLQDSTPEDLLAGDVDPVPGEGGRVYGDGSLTVGDAVRILRYVVGLMDAGEFYGGEPSEVDPDAPSLQLNTQAARLLFGGASGAEAPLSVNVVGAREMSLGGFTLSILAPAGALPVTIVGVERGALLPNGAEILTNPRTIPPEGVTTLRVAFNVTGLPPVAGYGELIRLTLKSAAPVPSSAVYTIILTGPDFATEDAASLSILPLEKSLSHDD